MTAVGRVETRFGGNAVLDLWRLCETTPDQPPPFEKVLGLAEGEMGVDQFPGDDQPVAAGRLV